MSTVVRHTTLITVVLSGDVPDCAFKTLAGGILSDIAIYRSLRPCVCSKAARSPSLDP